MVHDEFTAWLATIAPKQELLGHFREFVEAMVERRADIEAEQFRLARESTQNANLELDELIEMRAQRLITDGEFQKARTRLTDRRFTVATASDQKFFLKTLAADLSKIFDALQNLVETWLALPAYLHGKFEALLLPSGFVRGSIRTAELGPLFRVFGGLCGSNIKGFIEILQQLEEYNKAKITEFELVCK
jgi:hypothetical protein